MIMKKQALYLAPAIELSNLVEEEAMLTDSAAIKEITGDTGVNLGFDDVEGLNGQARTLLNNLIFH